MPRYGTGIDYRVNAGKFNYPGTQV